MAQAVRAGSLAVYAQFDTLTTRTVPAGSGWADGDILVAVGYDNGTTPSFTMPANWNVLNSGSQGGDKWVLGWILRTGGANPDLGFGVGTTSSRYVEIYIIALTGVHPTSPIAGTPAYGAGCNGNSATCFPDGPSADVGTSSLVLIGGAKRQSATDLWTAPAGYTTLGTFSTGQVAFAHSNSLLSGTQDPDRFTGDEAGTTDGWFGFTVGFAPSEVSPAVVKKAAAEVLRPFNMSRLRR